jgi:hypothetical protein
MDRRQAPPGPIGSKRPPVRPRPLRRCEALPAAGDLTDNDQNWLSNTEVAIVRRDAEL